jgi:hypothetical protein
VIITSTPGLAIWIGLSVLERRCGDDDTDP